MQTRVPDTVNKQHMVSADMKSTSIRIHGYVEEGGAYHEDDLVHECGWGRQLLHGRVLL